MGFDDFATGNLRTLLTDQLRSTGAVPTDTTLIVERFRDELGDWRIVLHCPYGLRVNGPLALAISDRLQQRYGVSESPTATDDGIVVRLPDTDDSPPGADLFVFDATEIESIVTREVGGSALFAARFRECAARALLLPAAHPDADRRCGSSGSGPPNCSTSRVNIPISRWSWRRCANACKTCTTSALWCD